MASGSENLRVDDDGLMTPEVGGWAETKYRLLALYNELFSTGMKNKWDQRVYVDLYAGAGYSRIQGTGRVLKGSPVIALTVTHPFDKHIFCEEREDLLEALKARAQWIASRANVAYIRGNCDAEIERTCKEIPKASSTNKVLSLCLVDPYDFGLKFETLRRLSTVFIDFVALLALGGHLKTGHQWTLQNRPTEQNQNKSIYNLRDGVWANIFFHCRAAAIYTNFTWAEDMATQGCDQSADSAAGMARGDGVAPQAELPFWRQSDKSQGFGDRVPKSCKRRCQWVWVSY